MRIFKVWGAFFLLVFYGCSETETPTLGGGVNRDIFVESLVFEPSRRYITTFEDIPLRGVGIRLGYSCSEIESFTLRDTGERQWQLQITGSWPGDFTQCPLEPQGGRDSIFTQDFSLASATPQMIYLRGTSETSTDSALLISEVHSLRDTQWTHLDSALLADSSSALINSLTDSLVLDCGDSLSYGAFCISENSDTLFLKYMVTSGWEEGCEGTARHPIADHSKYFVRITPNEVHCLTADYPWD